MSIDKTVRSDKVELSTALWFGAHKGKTPSAMLKSKKFEEIRYLLWLRTELNPQGYPRFMCSLDIHHALDQILRKNPNVFLGYEPHFSASDYDVWRAEKRLEIKANELRKEQEIIRKREELARFQEEQRRKDEAAKLRHQKYLQDQELLILKQKADQAEREAIYATSWGDW